MRTRSTTQTGAEAWKTAEVSEAEWARLRGGLRAEAERWLATLNTPRDVSGLELGGMISSIVHLAYHLGAIRQIDPAVRGPRETSGSLIRASPQGRSSIDEHLRA